MKYKPVLHILGIFLMLHSLGLLPPMAISIYMDGGLLRDFLYTFVFTFGACLLLWGPLRHATHELRRHEGFLIVAGFWLVLSAMSAIPFILGPHLDFFDAFIEATSAFTTTVGFSTCDASMGHFKCLSIELIAGFFMLMGALNFSVHSLAIHRLELRYYLDNP